VALKLDSELPEAFLRERKKEILENTLLFPEIVLFEHNGYCRRVFKH